MGGELHKRVRQGMQVWSTQYHEATIKIDRGDGYFQAENFTSHDF